MTDTLLLDTHIVLWLDSGDDQLHLSTRALLDGCWQNGGTILLSAVTARKVALLVDTGRIELDGKLEGFKNHPPLAGDDPEDEFSGRTARDHQASAAGRPARYGSDVDQHAPPSRSSRRCTSKKRIESFATAIPRT